MNLVSFLKAGIISLIPAFFFGLFKNMESLHLR